MIQISKKKPKSRLYPDGLICGLKLCNVNYDIPVLNKPRQQQQQEVHRPQCSHEKTVQINKHTWLYYNVD